MQSPFPGMNPYLEGHRWIAFHGDLCTEIRRQLAPQLAPRYFPDTTRYFIPDIEGDFDIGIEQIIPDVGVAEHGEPSRPGVIMLHEVPHYRIDIRDVDHNRLVTAIEFWSPTNKRGKGRGKCLQKRNRLLLSSAHLIEIDLLRQGERAPMVQPYPPGSYFVLVSRAEQRPEAHVWPVELDQKLPTVPVPLLRGDNDAAMDLQQAVHNVYALGGYDIRIDYPQPPDIPLASAEAAWVDARLREAGRRK